MDQQAITLYLRPDCSKCREVERLLAEHDVAVERREFLNDPLDRAELETLLKKLGTQDPRVLIRTGDEAYRARGLAGARRDELLDALVAEPALLQRPIAIRRGRAMIARPPERVLDLLDHGSAGGD